ncbi:transglycosylase domain-containing protein [Corallococcus sp. RDP092CA]|uniref:transglycosylase domain-containing protein n=1 Tax=Corallococcus sp. RDP092CA TaxID=3109369 RepID=UPI0035AE9224
MKTVFWLLMFLVGLAGVVIPLTYLYTASKLPRMESEFDVESQLRHRIEGDRMSILAGRMDQGGRERTPVTFARPDFSRLPKDLVALYIRQMDCPTYFQTPREDGRAWAWRLFAGVTLGTSPRGDGSCERWLAMRIAREMGIEGDLQLSVAAHRLHAFFQKDQLVAYDLATIRFERGVIGVEDAARKLFGRELGDLQLSELAELQLALPPYGFYGDIKACKNASLIRQNRDLLLQDLAGYALVSEERARNAIAQPVACLSVK